MGEDEQGSAGQGTELEARIEQVLTEARMVLAPMVPLALGIAGDFYVVAAKVTGSAPLAIAMATLALGLFYGLWFGFTLYRRRPRRGGACRRTLLAPPRVRA